MKFTGKLFGFISVEQSNPTRREVAVLFAITMLTTLLTGAVALWGGSWLLHQFVTAFSVPTLGFLESVVIFAVTSFVVWIFRQASNV